MRIALTSAGELVKTASLNRIVGIVVLGGVVGAAEGCLGMESESRKLVEELLLAEMDGFQCPENHQEYSKY